MTRDAIYRHAHATGLFPKRQRNIRAALERIIEQCSEVTVNAAAVVSAIAAYGRINAVGQWIPRGEVVTLDELFQRMTKDELAAYVREGTLPTWFPISLQHEVNDNDL